MFTLKGTAKLYAGAALAQDAAERSDGIEAGDDGRDDPAVGLREVIDGRVVDVLVGIALDEVDSRSMLSKRVPGLYIAGEVLDLDGPIGGYNFQAAWSTGWLAGESV